MPTVWWELIYIQHRDGISWKLLLLVSTMKYILNIVCGSCQQKERLRQKEAGVSSSWVKSQQKKKQGVVGEDRRSEGLIVFSTCLDNSGLLFTLSTDSQKKPRRTTTAVLCLLTPTHPHPTLRCMAAHSPSDESLKGQRSISFIRQGGTSECPACERSQGVSGIHSWRIQEVPSWSTRAEKPFVSDVREQSDNAATFVKDGAHTAAWKGKSPLTN